MLLGVDNSGTFVGTTTQQKMVVATAAATAAAAAGSSGSSSSKKSTFPMTLLTTTQKKKNQQKQQKPKKGQATNKASSSSSSAVEFGADGEVLLYEQFLTARFALKDHPRRSPGDGQGLSIDIGTVNFACSRFSYGARGWFDKGRGCWREVEPMFRIDEYRVCRLADAAKAWAADQKRQWTKRSKAYLKSLKEGGGGGSASSSGGGCCSGSVNAEEDGATPLPPPPPPLPLESGYDSMAVATMNALECAVLLPMANAVGSKLETVVIEQQVGPARKNNLLLALLVGWFRGRFGDDVKIWVVNSRTKFKTPLAPDWVPLYALDDAGAAGGPQSIPTSSLVLSYGAHKAESVARARALLERQGGDMLEAFGAMPIKPDDVADTICQAYYYYYRCVVEPHLATRKAAAEARKKKNKNKRKGQEEESGGVDGHDEEAVARKKQKCKQ